jgi:SAM-dependent methyltransferase
MSKTFNAYSHYYDLLYQDKDYIGESQYIHRLLREWAPNAKGILELGCGTGRHGELLCKLGYDVTGVEASEEMLSKAKERSLRVNIEDGGSFDVLHGDARRIQLGRKFDSILSLFHVVSYQCNNRDVGDLFCRVSEHLSEGGIFLFDVWYGPAVLATQPAVRVKRMSSDLYNIIRIAEPRLDTAENTVDVQYTVMIQSKEGEQLPEIHETHKMRYFFQPELSLIAAIHGLEIIHTEEWLTAGKPSSDTWGVLFVARKV